jgi:protein disulfide-isomerase A1
MWLIVGCGHCKKLAPIWDQLGTAFSAASDKVTIAKMDVTENDLPPSSKQRIDGFPTIKLFKAEDNSVVEYQGDRSLADLADFLKKNAVHAEALKDISIEEQEEEKADASPHDEL